MPDGLDKAREYFDSGRYVEAVAAWRELAEHGSAEAQYNLGTCYEYGQGVTQSYETVVEWYIKPPSKGMRRRSLTSPCATKTDAE